VASPSSPLERAARRQSRMGGVRRDANLLAAHGRRGQCGRKHLQDARRRIPRCQPARLRSENRPVGHLVARRPQPLRRA